MDTPDDLVFRPLAADDDLEELTELLHRSYAELAAMGLRYVATYQDATVTARRAAQGECTVASLGDRLVATITLVPPGRAEGCPWYERPDVAMFTQFCVDPSLRGRGVGGHLLSGVEARAATLGAAEVALDTAEPATHLLRWYGARGYRPVAAVDWAVTNYRSVVLSKTLPARCPGSRYREE